MLNITIGSWIVLWLRKFIREICLIDHHTNSPSIYCVRTRGVIEREISVELREVHFDPETRWYTRYFQRICSANLETRSCSGDTTLSECVAVEVKLCTTVNLRSENQVLILSSSIQDAFPLWDTWRVSACQRLDIHRQFTTLQRRTPWKTTRCG